ncbi:putative MFS transporter [Tersicoccus solisilvae]|uniref:MFS transporter n=1 Tax=Tersicoccus solisilvae TaxID=1882339 RepID=A0ABQ1PAH7_9MICC|nr:putative MFS transporter [Tersicoccus solisilvae]
MLALTGIMLLAFTLRVAVTDVTPLVSTIARDVPLNATTTGLLGMLPPIAFAVFGALTPVVLRRLSGEWLAVLAMTVSIVGQVGRALTSDTGVFLTLSVFAVAGLGVGNVLLPPLVKKYFPDAIGGVTALYVTILAISTAVPPLVAVPLAEATSWRVSTGAWALACLVAALPWLGLVRSPRGRTTVPAAPAPESEAPVGDDAPITAERAEPAVVPVIRPWRSPLAWGLVAMMGFTSFNTFSMFTWLPQIVLDAGLDRAGGGAMLSLFAFIGMPLSLIVPVLAARMRNPYPLCLVGVVTYAVGYFGLLGSSPGSVWLWVSLMGVGQASFPLALVLINLRTRTYRGAQALSGFAQGLGYAFACLGPLFVGIIHEATGGWFAPMLLLCAGLVVVAVGGAVCCRPRMLEDQLARL